MVIGMVEIKQKTKEIYEVLPKLDDGRCGYKTCGAFAKAVVEGRAPCYGCVSGAHQVAAKVCQIMDVTVPKEETALEFSASPELYQAGFVPGHRGLRLGRTMERGFGRGRQRRRYTSLGRGGVGIV